MEKYDVIIIGAGVTGTAVAKMCIRDRYKSENVDVLNYVNITDLLTENGRVYGAVGFSIMEETAYVIHAKAVLIATGGAAGLYKPNNPGFVSYTHLILQNIIMESIFH